MLNIFTINPLSANVGYAKRETCPKGKQPQVSKLEGRRSQKARRVAA